ncbi:hypothetical protein [Plesiomonas shigelloides]|uniref:hypothetical protein n=1 Tax=Plesiomonas shigelloides TaxID=703 RepID=UPI0012621E6B|nr:hypothetical protein [Plesiomonas shigelloides]KAB7693563.1 hypothetical protein GBN28_01075 [Plesiomonas shigelloides]
MQTYEFTLHLMPTGLPTDEEFELFDRQLSRVCSDALLVSYQDRCFLNFLRLAENEREAVLSALEDIQQAGFHVLEENAPEQVIVSYLPCPAY